MNAYHLAALPPVLLVIAVPELWPWALAVAAFVTIAALAAAAHHFHQGRESWRAEAVRAVRELEAYAEARAEADLLSGRVVDVRPIRPGKGTRLGLVPPSAEVTGSEWPRLMRAVEGEVEG